MPSPERNRQILKVRLNQAKEEATLSYAKRLKVGALIVIDDRIISQGRNGMPSGVNNDCEDVITSELLVDNKSTGKFEEILVTKPGLVHAEMNVIAFAARKGMSTNQCIMIITHSPCFECSKLIIQSGIKKVYYETEYRLTEGLDFLRECGVEVERIYDENNESGEAKTS